MKGFTRLIATTLCAVSLLVFPNPPRFPQLALFAKADPAILESVRPLQWVDLDQYTSLHLNTHCTTFNVNREAHTWMTAAHCVATAAIGDTGVVHLPIIADHEFFIDGHLAVVVFADFGADIAVLHTDDSSAAVPLKLAKDGSAYLTPITIAGYPYGLGPILNAGHVARPSMITQYGVRMILSVTGCPGNSGSPAVNQRNEVVSMIQAGVTNSGGCATLMAGATSDDLTRLVGRYFGK